MSSPPYLGSFWPRPPSGQALIWAAVPATARGRQECGTHDDRPVTFAQTVRRPVVPRRMLLRATCASPKVGSLGLPRETGRGTRGGDFVNGHDDLRAASQEIFPVVATGFSLWTDVRSPQRLVRQRITPYPAVACARRGLTVGDHGGNANGLRWTLSRDQGWLVCWTCSGRAAIQWVERNAQSGLPARLWH